MIKGRKITKAENKAKTTIDSKTGTKLRAKRSGYFKHKKDSNTAKPAGMSKPVGTARSAGKMQTVLKAGAKLNGDIAATGMGIRLNKFIAMHTGVSRRSADGIIKEGKVIINGKKIINLAVSVKKGDEVVIGGKKIIYKDGPKIYIMLNKPQGYITAVKSEEGFKTVMELIKKETLKHRHIFPAGRLDFMSEGLLLLTNDGDFAYKLTHPKFDVVKTYIVEAKGELTPSLFNRIKKGVRLDETGLLKPDDVRIIGKKPAKFILSVDLAHGKNREIRRLMEFFSLKILSLKRVRIGGLYIGDLPSGEYRILSRKAAELALESRHMEEPPACSNAGIST